MVRYRKGHRNSKGEKAEWCIVSHETGKVLSSHKSKSAAEKHLGDMRKFKHMKENSGNTRLDNALVVLEGAGYICEAAVVATPTFDEYKEQVTELVKEKLGTERAEQCVEYFESDLQDYCYRTGDSAQQGAESVIEWTTPSEKQKEILDFMYNNYDCDFARSFGPDPAYDQCVEYTKEQLDLESSLDFPSDSYEFEILYGKPIDE